MTPTLRGRIETRVALLVAVGLPWTVLFVVVTHVAAAGAFAGWGVLTVLAAAVWEPFYHLVQQCRWEKDWPILFALGTIINEAALTGVITGRLLTLNAGTYVAQVVTTWVLVWLVTVGPMRVVVLRWRYRGGRIW